MTRPPWPAAERRGAGLLGRGGEALIGLSPAGPEGEEAVLLRRLRERDETALASLYRRHAGLVYALALRIVGDRHLAEEVLQDAFLRCWDEVAQFDPARGRLSSWLLGVARHRAIDLLRSRQHQARLHERGALPPADRPGPYGPQGPAGPSSDDLVLLRETVSRAMDGLPLPQRQAIALAYFGGLTQSEIAALLGVPLGTVKTRIRDGMERLRRVLRPVLDPDVADVTPVGDVAPVADATRADR
jgi:RNA polymerase sigma-70 factor, ECF subfamily